jgi:hypothetical protein
MVRGEDIGVITYKREKVEKKMLEKQHIRKWASAKRGPIRESPKHVFTNERNKYPKGEWWFKNKECSKA